MQKDIIEKLFVHATNICGLGASQVASSLIDAFSKIHLVYKIDCYLPDCGPFANFRVTDDKINLIRFHRKLPYSLSRILECLLSRFYFPNARHTLILGDFPLYGFRDQVVLVHQPHLVKPKVNPLVSTSSSYSIMRWLFENNLRFVKKIVVQSDVLKRELEDSYPQLSNKIEVVTQPPPNWIKKNDKKKQSRSSDALTLFYPSAGYPHKNHTLLNRMHATISQNSDLVKELIVTLDINEQACTVNNIAWVNNMGRLDHQSCLTTYYQADALFFPSLAESFGLPLAEAMFLELPILCSDLPYAHWLCEDQAIYFNPQSADSAWKAIRELRYRLSTGWQVDWTKPLSKLTKSWEEVATKFCKIFKLPAAPP